MTWHNPTTNPPPPYVDVLLAVAGETHAAEGWRGRADDGYVYIYSTGHPVTAEVLAWAELPALPAPLHSQNPKPKIENTK